MLNDDARALLEGGCALIVGLTRPDGSPFATRAWGCDIDPSGGGALLLVRATDAASFGLQVGDVPGIPIAVTAADVRSLSSVQVKGVLVELTPAEEGDAERKDRYCDLFVAAVQEVDGIPIEIAERWRPADALLRCRIRFEELFLQTPGPGAGASLGRVDP